MPTALKAETTVLTFGSGGKEIADTVGIETLSLGHISSDGFKAVAYSAADLFLLPTCADNLPLVLYENIACGTPMVSFKTGGVPNLVRLGITSCLAQPEDEQDLALSVEHLLDDTTLREQISRNCREIALQEYSLNLQAEHYISLYKQALN